jgi:hypothetical protein
MQYCMNIGNNVNIPTNCVWNNVYTYVNRYIHNDCDIFEVMFDKFRVDKMLI